MRTSRTHVAPYLLAVAACYAAAAFGMGLFLQAHALFPTGSDALAHLYKSQTLLSCIQDGAAFPYMDVLWDNGEQLLLSWPPLPVLALAACLHVARGDAIAAFALLGGALLFANGLIGAVMGAKLNRKALGAVLGGLWFVLPNNVWLLFVDGDIPSAIVFALLPALVFCAWWWIQRRSSSTLVLVAAIVAAMALCQPSDALLIACALGAYLVVYGIANHMAEPQLWVAGAVACGFAIAGIWLVPAVCAGGTLGEGLALAQPEAGNWTALLDPVAYASQQGYGCYVGLVALALILLGIVAAPFRHSPAFVTALLALVFAPFALGAAGGALADGQLWQLSLPALASVVLGFALTGLALWGSMRMGLVAAFCALLALGAVPQAMGALAGSNEANEQADAWLQAQDTELASNDDAMWAAARLSELKGTHHPVEFADALPLLEEAKGLVRQRLSIVSGYGRSDGLAYAASGMGLHGRQDATGPVAVAQGADRASSTLADRYELLDEALEEGDFLYLFDRNVELGCDVVLVRTPAAEGFDAQELERMDADARQVGYVLAAANDSYRLYRLRGATSGFGSTAEYSAIAIGRNAETVSLGFPNVVPGDSENLDDYTFEELSAYRTVLVCSVDYDDQQAAEGLVRKLSEAGTRVVILADGIPEDRTTHDCEFLGVRCNEITFSGGYPTLDTIEGAELPDLFPLGTGEWKTVYLEGLDDSWGTIDDSELGRSLSFIGTVENDDIVFVGLNLTYYYSMTRDDFVGRLLSHALGLSPDELPERTLTQVRTSLSDGTLKVSASEDDVATGLAWVAGLSSGSAKSHRGQICVDAGTTTATVSRPLAMQGGVCSLAGLVLLERLAHAACRRRKEAASGDDAAAVGDATAGDGSEEG